MTSTYCVNQIAENIFKMAENCVCNSRLTFGAEFETRINAEGQHEIIKIIKESPYKTTRFFLNSQFTQAEYRLLGDEITKNGGFWQVDFGSMAIINLPKDCALNLNEIFKIFNFHPTMISD